MRHRRVWSSCVLAISLSFAAGSNADAGKLRIVTTTTNLAWFAETIGGERVEVSSIARGYQDPHYIEPKPSYIVRLSRANLVLHVGMELEVGWLPKLLDGAHNPDIQPGQPGLYTPAAEVTVVEKPVGALDRTHGDVHPFGNPHYWLSPTNAVAIARGIAGRLSELDPDGDEVYGRNAAALVATIEAKDAEWRARLASASGTHIVTYHRTFSYFVDHFGLVVSGFVEPKPGVPPSARHLAQLIKVVDREHVKLILLENFFETKHGEVIASKTGVPLVVAPISVGGQKGIDSWFDLIESLVGHIEKAAGTLR